MDRATFEAGLARDGYAASEGSQPANHANPMHAHDFDARVMVLDGDITIEFPTGPVHYKAGDHCDVPAGTRHAERVGPNGVRFLAGRRSPA